MKFLKTGFALLLLFVGLLFVYFIYVVITDEILPALDDGSLTVSTSSTILNRVWVGNEIYLLLMIYAGVAAGLITTGCILVRNALRRRNTL